MPGLLTKKWECKQTVWVTERRELSMIKLGLWLTKSMHNNPGEKRNKIRKLMCTNYTTGMRKFRTEISNLSTWMIYWARKSKSADMTSIQQSLVCVVPRWWSSRGNRKVFSDVWRKYEVCIRRWYLWHFHAKARLQKFWGWNFLCKYGDRKRNVSKTNWKILKRKIN